MQMIERATITPDPLDPAIHLIPKEQLDRVFSQRDCDIDPTFLGFTNIYLALAGIIPKHWTVVDLGCALAPQAFIFKDHTAYIGVDFGETERFSASNTTHYMMNIENFISTHIGDFDLNTTFAICSYVPPWGGDNMARVRSAFKNVFTYYPAGSPHYIFGNNGAALQESKETQE
ncbi:hypothetical protein G6M02_08280 [Agrobacterium rhizogenes]|nr:hypothetical protein [Rhizobium rhizogenes]